MQENALKWRLKNKAQYIHIGASKIINNTYWIQNLKIYLKKTEQNQDIHEKYGR
jgi:hypothetical protein